MDNEALFTLTADIVSAHVGNNKVQSEELAGLIQSVYAALANAAAPVEEIAAQEPAVAIRSSVKAAAITCLECGKKMKMLKRHLSTDHQLAPADYRGKWGLSPDYPMVAPQYAAKRAELAKKIGLGRKPGASGKPAAAKSGARKAPADRAQPAGT